MRPESLARSGPCGERIRLWKHWNHGVGSIDQIILKNVLTVDASKHHMVDACSAILPYLSGPGGDIPAMGREFFPDLGIPLGM